METTAENEETASYMIVAETVDEMSEGEYRTETDTAYTTDEVALSDAVEEAQDDTTEQTMERLVEEYKPVNIDSLYDLTLEE